MGCKLDEQKITLMQMNVVSQGYIYISETLKERHQRPGGKGAFVLFCITDFKALQKM